MDVVLQFTPVTWTACFHLAILDDNILEEVESIRLNLNTDDPIVSLAANLAEIRINDVTRKLAVVDPEGFKVSIETPF